jgi:hypothetical protein
MLCFGTQLRLLTPVCQIILNVPPVFGAPGAGAGAAGFAGAGAAGAGAAGAGAAGFGAAGAGAGAGAASSLAQPPISKLLIVTIARTNINNFFIFIFSALLYQISSQ